jgi:hypothetical protein
MQLFHHEALRKARSAYSVFKEPEEAAFAVNSQQTKFVKACILNSWNTQSP